MNNEMKVLKASEVAPAAFASNKTSIVLKEDDIEYDLGNLAAFDTHPFKYTNEENLIKHTRENVQLLINKIFELPREISDLGPLAKLPEPIAIIPREKPLPKPKVETKWEKFAKDKGIVNRKKSRMVYDEEKEEYAPRWGYKRANDDQKDWAVEVKGNDKLMDDPWTKRKQEKTERINKNMRQLKQNQLRNNKKSNQIPTGIPVELSSTDDKKLKQRGKEGTKKTLEKVQFSTASLGKFDKMRQGEKERKQRDKRNQFLPVVGKETIEKDRSLTILDRILGKDDSDGKAKKRSIVDIDTDDMESQNKKKKKKGKTFKNITKGKAKKMVGKR